LRGRDGHGTIRHVLEIRPENEKPLPTLGGFFFVYRWLVREGDGAGRVSCLVYYLALPLLGAFKAALLERVRGFSFWSMPNAWKNIDKCETHLTATVPVANIGVTMQTETIGAARPARTLITLKEAAQRANVSRTTLWRLSAAKQFIPIYQLTSHRVAVCAEDLDAWLDTRIQQAA
jgi:predicted DNA-binding transcriptional regulator AlpA